MNILHVNSYAFGGAFTGAYRLHKALLNQGVNSKMLVKGGGNIEKFDNVYMCSKKLYSPRIINTTLAWLGYPITARHKRDMYIKKHKGDFEIISFPFSDYDITKTTLYKEADIIHLHWIADFVDYNSFFRKNKKPLVITLRDLNPLLGIFHYEGDINNNDSFWQLLDGKISDLKFRFFKQSQSKVHIVGISRWITEKSQNSRIFHEYKHCTVNNCINIEGYKKIDKRNAKKLLNINEDSIVLSFVSQGLNIKRKGIDLLINAVKELPYLDNLVILTVGSGEDYNFPLQVVHRHLGKRNQNDLNIIYAASDAFIFPTREEALGNVMLEAMACGTPVIGTPVGGLLDVIIPEFNGLFCDDISSEALRGAIIKFLKIKTQFNSDNIRNYISEKFNEKITVEKYLKIYDDVL